MFARITEIGPDGAPRLREAPPLLQHINLESEAALVDAIGEYLASVPVDVALLLSHFRITDVALRVVGVGSVGTRCYLLILVGPNEEPLILQIKEAVRSVLDEFGGRAQPADLHAVVDEVGQGRRVVDGQQILQAMSDVFLGTVRIAGRDFYVRQFHDMKGSIDTEGMAPVTFGEYVQACAVLLARAHAQSANASVLRGYAGASDAVARAVIEWSYAYADKALDDFHQLRAAAAANLGARLSRNASMPSRPSAPSAFSEMNWLSRSICASIALSNEASRSFFTAALDPFAPEAISPANASTLAVSSAPSTT
jgi:uncharacterized protein (DUF2252 family)